MNAPSIGAAVTALAAGSVAAFQETVAAGGDRRPVGEIVTIISAVGVLAGIVGGIIVQVVTLRIKAAVAPVVASVAEVAAKADVIGAKVDGTATKMAADYESSLREIERLTAANVEQKHEQVAAVLAATQATQPVSAEPGGGRAEAHLEQIETNTDKTAKNTAKTDATMTAIKKKATKTRNRKA